MKQERTFMNEPVWTKKKATITLTLIAIITVSSIIILQTNPTTQAALINPHPGIVGWWNFDEDVGAIAGDGSGNGNNGAISGATWTAGKYGQALSFNGASNYVGVASSSSLQITGTITLEAWVKTSDINKQAVITKSGSYLLYVGTLGDGKVYSYLYGTTSTWKAGTKNIADNLWHHIVLTYDPNAGANNFKLYADGILDAQYTVTGNIANTGNRVGIGDRRDVGFRDFFNGVIDEAQIYNRVLSAGEIQTNSQKSPDFSSNLLVEVPEGTTQVLTTLSWVGDGSINAEVISPSNTYSEDEIPVYQKTSYYTSSGISSMLNIKRLSVSVPTLLTDQSWYVMLTFDNVDVYQVTIEVQK